MLAITPIIDTYLSAEELGITAQELEALKWVREELASGRILHVKDEDAKDVGAAFNMLVAGRGCGTPACIAGWMATALGCGSSRGQRSQLDKYCLSGDPLEPLYFPGSHINFLNSAGYRDLTPAQAVKAIDFWATGHQQDCWRLALAEG